MSSLLVLLSPTFAGAQTVVSPAPATSGAFPRLTLAAALFTGLPRRTVTVIEDKGESTSYSGVDLGALLAKSGAPNGLTLRGRAAADYVVVRAADGYRALFSLTELDATITDKIGLVADQRNGTATAPISVPIALSFPTKNIICAGSATSPRSMWWPRRNGDKQSPEMTIPLEACFQSFRWRPRRLLRRGRSPLRPRVSRCRAF